MGDRKKLATPHAGLKKRHEIATDIRQNMFGFCQKNMNSVKLKLAVEVYCICQKNNLHLCVVCTDLFLSDFL